ncbi:fibronectin type III domain-containing protein [Bacillus mobilis]|uniref:fibronectin type III domain-containing protein n=1 Tax=Bacillus mobilis TaxID=2026190 RepID=UPI0021D2C26A|nr:fibronectin type III domain-containing protein [Bacillus mobilis]MCU5197935.1 fibronectin type III domain-containing protein [Bacillus mobilis]
MKIKKCGFLLLLVMLICFALPSLSSAETIDILKGKEGTFSNGVKTKQLTDGLKDTGEDMFRTWGNGSVKFDLGKTYSIDSYIVTATTRSGYDDAVVYFYDSNNKRIFDSHGSNVTIKVDGVQYVELINKNTSWSLPVFEFNVFADDGLISNVSSLDVKTDSDKATLTWLNPKEEIFNGVSVYQNDKKIVNLDKETTSYTIKNLKPVSKYVFKVVSIGSDGTESKGVTKEITLDMPLISPPESVFVTPQDGKVVVAWGDIKSPYLKGYNVYIDGKKINDEPLVLSKMIIKNLENGKSYKIQVSAVNKNDKEGEKSKGVSEKPSSDALEVEYDVKMPFDVKDVLGVVMVFLMVVGPLILLGLAMKFYKPIITFLYKSIPNKKRRD